MGYYGQGHYGQTPYGVLADTRTPVSSTSSSLAESLQGVDAQSAGLLEAKAPVTVASNGLLEAADTVTAGSQGAIEALRAVTAQAPGLLESGAALAVTSTGLVEAEEIPTFQASSFSRYWSAEAGAKPIRGGSAVWSRGGTVYHLDAHGRYRRLPADYIGTRLIEMPEGVELPVMPLERAGIARNADTARFDAGSAWTVGTFASVDPVATPIDGEYGWLFEGDGSTQGQDVRQAVGTLTGSEETLSAILEADVVPGSGVSRIEVRDTDAGTVVAAAEYDWEAGTLSVPAGSGEVLESELDGYTGRNAVRITARGSGTADNARQLRVYPLGTGAGSETGRVVVQHVQHEEQGYASSPIVASASGTSRATTDWYMQGAPRVDQAPWMLYLRVLPDFAGDDGLTNPRLVQIGGDTPPHLYARLNSNDLEVVHDNGTTTEVVAVSAGQGVGEALELYVRLEPSGRARVGVRVEGGSPASAILAQQDLVELSQHRVTLNAQIGGGSKGAGLYDALKVVEPADLESRQDGTEDEALFTELRGFRLAPDGTLYWIPS